MACCALRLRAAAVDFKDHKDTFYLCVLTSNTLLELNLFVEKFTPAKENADKRVTHTFSKPVKCTSIYSLSNCCTAGGVGVVSRRVGCPWLADAVLVLSQYITRSIILYGKSVSAVVVVGVPRLDETPNIKDEKQCLPTLHAPLLVFLPYPPIRGRVLTDHGGGAIECFVLTKVLRLNKARSTQLVLSMRSAFPPVCFSKLAGLFRHLSAQKPRDVLSVLTTCRRHPQRIPRPAVVLFPATTRALPNQARPNRHD